MATLTVGSLQAYNTISAAVAAAKPGDTILVQAGTYTNDFPAIINGLTLDLNSDGPISTFRGA